MKRSSEASAPTIQNRTVARGRLRNADYRTREYLTEREVERLAASMRALNLSSDAPATIARGDGKIIPFGFATDGHQLSILESIVAHEEQFDTPRQCADLKSILHPG